MEAWNDYQGQTVATKYLMNVYAQNGESSSILYTNN